MSLASRAATSVCPAPYRELFFVQEKALSNELTLICPTRAALINDDDDEEEEEEDEEEDEEDEEADELLISAQKAFDNSRFLWEKLLCAHWNAVRLRGFTPWAWTRTRTR